MKAAIVYEQGQPFQVEDVRLEAPRKHEVLVRIGAAGVCRSDYHVLKGEARHPVPVVLGHEGAGVVEEVGPDVTMVKPGDHVVLSFTPNCGHCYYCNIGKPNLCDALPATAGRLFDGTTRLFKGDTPIHHLAKVACFAERVVVPDTGCIPIPKTVPFHVAALVGCCVPTGIGAISQVAQVKPGSTVAVVGSGGVGLNVIQGARLVNASKIIAVDILDHKLEFAYKFGATHTVNAAGEDAVAKVKEITDGLGVDYAFEVFGSADTAVAAFEMTRKAGTVVVVGLAPVWERAAIDVATLTRTEKVIRGTYYGSVRPRQDMPKIIDMYLKGQIDIDNLVTKHYKLDQINEAFDALEKGETAGRAVIDF